MKVRLAYGQGHLPVELPDGLTTIIEPAHTPGLADERGAVLAALEKPIAARPLREWVKPGSRVCIVFTDITRATPNERLIPWLLDYLADVPRENITLLNGVGTHRPNTRAELEQMLTPAVVQNYRVLNHEAGECQRAGPAGHDARRHPGAAQPPLCRGRRAHRHWLHRAAFLCRIQRRPQGHHAGRRRFADRDEQSRRKEPRRSQCDLWRDARATRFGRKCATSPCAPARASC